MRKRTLADILISNTLTMKKFFSDRYHLWQGRQKNESNYLPENRSSNPLISIVIPTYDRGKLLVERTLPSIFAQTYQNFEVIVIGDKCDQETVNYLSTVTDPRFKFINLEERGQYPSDVKLRWFVAGTKPTNYGRHISKGEWIANFDDDDVMTPDHLQVLLDFANEGNYEFVAGLYEEEREGTRTVSGYKQDNGYEFGGHCTWLYRSYLKNIEYDMNCWRKSYNCPRDVDMLHRLYTIGVRMELTEKVVSYILPREGETTVGLAAHLAKGI